MYEVHPFTRPFDEDTERLTVLKPYDAIGPFGELDTYAWRMQDILNAIVTSGFSLKHIEEMYAEYNTYWFEVSGEREKMSQEEVDKLYKLGAQPVSGSSAMDDCLCR